MLARGREGVAPQARWIWIGLTAGLVVSAIVVRVVLNFSRAYPPGVNAAYYPLQARSWLLHGRLMYDDLPLIFWIDAGLGRALTAFGRPLDAALLSATRIVDSTMQPLAALAVLALGFVWSKGRWRAIVGCLAAAAFVVLSPLVLRMLSDFEKNSLGLVFMCAALWICRAALMSRRRATWLLLCLVLVLAALTHVGAFGMTATMVFVAMALWAGVSLPRENRRRALAFAAGGAVLLLALLAVFDPHRAGRLLGAPSRLFADGPIEWLPVPVLVIGAALVAVTVRLAWRDRNDLDAADLAIVSGAVAALAAIAVPKSFVYVDRFALMTPVPVAVLLAFVVARSRRADLWFGLALLVVAIYAAAWAPEAVQPSFMTREVADELNAIKAHIADADATLVLAPHGMEWWAGYLLGTPVRSGVPSDISKYRRVLLLRNTVDCPRDLVNPFPAPSVRGTPRKIYAGRYVEIDEVL